MSSPINDNWANASSISGLSGSLYSNNISASMEVGEPGTANATVWYVWPNPYSTSANLPYLVEFDTISLYGTASTNYPSTLQIYGSSSPTASLSTMQEVTYVQNGSHGYGMQYGSKVIFSASAGYSYWIRVGSRDTGKTGNFVLNWNAAEVNNLGACNTCPPSFGAGETCFGSIQINDLFTTQTSSWSYYGSGSFPAGIYTIRYCKGYMPNVSWGTTFDCMGQSPNACRHFAQFLYTTDENVTFFYQNVSGSQSYTNFAPYHTSSVSAIDVMKSAYCSSIPILHTTGSIGLLWTASQWPAPAPNDGCCVTFWAGTPALTSSNSSNSVFGLYSVYPVLQLANPTNWKNNCGTTYSGVFNVVNLGNPQWESCSISIQNTGEVSASNSATTASYFGTIPPLQGHVGTNTLTFTRTTNSTLPFTVSASVYIAGYAGGKLSDIGMPTLTASLSYVMNPILPTGFVEAGTGNLTRSGDTLSGSFLLTYTGLTTGDFWGGCAYTASLRTGNGVSSVTGGQNQQCFNSATGTQALNFTFTTTTNNFNITAYIDIKDSTGAIVDTLVYNITPYPTLSLTQGGSISCTTTKTRCVLTVTNNGLGPTKALYFNLLSGVECTNSGWPKNIGVLLGGQSITYQWNGDTHNANYAFSHPSSWNLTDSGTTYPTVTMA